jgi:uncharacterized membrane protein
MTIRQLVIRRNGADPIVQSVGIIIPVGGRAEVPVAIALPPDTPPGEYPVEIELPHERQAAVLRVEPRHELRIRPGRVVVPVGATSVTFSVENTGNVVIPLAPVTTSEGSDVRLSLADTPSLEPGASADIRAEVTVDDQLDPYRRHELDVPVGTADVIFVVLARAQRERTSADRNQAT